MARDTEAQPEPISSTGGFAMPTTDRVDLVWRLGPETRNSEVYTAAMLNDSGFLDGLSNSWQLIRPTP
jgi:hypothetical protein